MYKIYIKTQNNKITAINSSAFLTNTTGWIEIDEGDGDRFMHAQGNYLPKPLVNEQGIYQYKYVNGSVEERTAEEIQADIDTLPTSSPSQLEILQDTVDALVIASLAE